MEYLIIGILIFWIIILYSKIHELTKNSTKKSAGLHQYNEKFDNQAEPDYKQFERDRLQKQKEAYNNSSRPIEKKKNHRGNPNYDLTPEEILMYKGNKFPSEYLYPKKDVVDNSSIFFEKKVCITGNFDEFPVRAELAEHLWNLGADIDTGVGKTLDFLLCGDGAGPSKCAKAEEQGVRIIEESELIELLPDFQSKYL